jgi:rhodanese-related sulfurtransferase
VQSSAGSTGGDVAREDVLLVSHLETAAPDAEHDITLDQIRQYVLDGTAVLVDVRSPESFARGHPRGAINLPAGPVEEMKDYLSQIWPSIADEELIILYCYGPACGSADMVSEYLRGEGFTNTRVYSPGWQTLAKAKDLQ